MSVHIRYFSTRNVAFVISHRLQLKKVSIYQVSVAVVSSDYSLLSVIFYGYFRTVVAFDEKTLHGISRCQPTADTLPLQWLLGEDWSLPRCEFGPRPLLDYRQKTNLRNGHIRFISSGTVPNFHLFLTVYA